MSVLIKGFIMPHCCDACSFSDWSNLHQTAVCKVNYYKPCFVDHSNEFLKRRSDSCPLVEIPEPHGDLIDRAMLDPDSDYEDGDFLAVSVAQIKLMSPVIEAEGSENE